MTNGQVGEYPEGYTVAKAALYWGISPQDAVNLPSYWVYLAGVISTAEHEVQEMKDKSTSKRSR